MIILLLIYTAQIYEMLYTSVQRDSVIKTRKFTKRQSNQ
jgi:hypothetical protein